MAKTDKKKQKQRRKSESEERSSDSSAESIDKKANKRRKTKRDSSSSDSDDEDNKTPSKMNRNTAKTDKKKEKQRRKSESEERTSDSSAGSIDKKPNKRRKTERDSSSSSESDEDNKTPSKMNIDKAKTDKRKQKQRRKSESEERTSDSSEESIDTKPNKRRKESVSTSSDSDNEDNKTAPPNDSDSDSETPQPSQKIAAHKTPTKSPNLLQTFKNTNELNDVSTKARPLLSDLSDSDVFFVQIPKGLHPQLLTDTLVSLDEKTKLRVGKTSYVWDTSGADPIPLNVMELRKKGKGVIKRLNCPRIIVREQFKLKQFPLELRQQPEEPVPYPADLKSRHPLFGSEYAERIKLDEGVKHKLNSAREKRVKEKRRKRDLKNESDVYEEMFLSQNDLGGVSGEKNQLNFEVKRKKKRKRELDQ